MDNLWTPWRFRYVSEAGKDERCVFCECAKSDTSQDREHLILYRGRSSYAMLNLYPYTTGHTLIAPYAHGPNLEDLPPEVLNEIMSLTLKVHGALRAVYQPGGFNLGMNLGKSAGAGVADHVHLHILPRWTGDTNFMTVVGETRVQPEELRTTYDKLVSFLRR